jgi:hypothetical protein
MCDAAARKEGARKPEVVRFGTSTVSGPASSIAKGSSGFGPDTACRLLME